MRQFFKFLFASCLGTLLALFVVFIVSTGILARLSADKPAKVSANSVLHLKLDEMQVPELTNNVEANSSFSFNQPDVLGLHDIIAAIRKAKDDDKIKGIFLETSNMMTGLSATREIRQALADFKAAGKFIYAYAPYYTQGAYYLASVADEVTVAPLGLVDWRGFSAQYIFMKDALDRLNVDFEVFYAGRYKSASEPYRRNDMSPESREQTRAFLNELYRLVLDDVAKSRSVSATQLRTLADSYEGLDTDKAKAAGLVDNIQYREDLLQKMREKLGIEEGKDINTVSLADYFSTIEPENASKTDRIAVIVAEGTIVDGKGEMAEVGDKRFVKVIEDIQKDKRVKAVVLRVNSPGGSAMASDHIWHQLMALKQTGKPLIVSMGATAASGGYYIACAGDSILAEPATITGSIGVVSAFPIFYDMMKDKLGLHVDSVSTGPMAGGITPLFPLSDQQRRLMQIRTDQMYKTFLERVSTGRKMTLANVDSVAQGRVWAAADALSIGLVDKIGNLNDAISMAANMAGVSDYGVDKYPQVPSVFEQIINQISGTEDVMARNALRTQLGSLYPYYRYVHELADAKGMQMRLPLVFNFE